jgi:hypothetical protein
MSFVYRRRLPPEQTGGGTKDTWYVLSLVSVLSDRKYFGI